MPEERDAPQMVALNTVAKGAGIVFTGVIASKVLSYLYRIFIARYFGPNDYGLLNLGLAIIGFLTIISLLGLPSGVTRYIAYYRTKRNESKIRGVVTTSVKLILPFSIALSVLLMASSSFLAEVLDE